MPTADLAVRRTTYAIENGRTLGASAVKETWDRAGDCAPS